MSSAAARREAHYSALQDVIVSRTFRAGAVYLGLGFALAAVYFAFPPTGDTIRESELVA